MHVVGIVGSPAGGKSTVARRLQELGATWIDADLIARGVLQEEPIRQALIDHFGREVTDSAGRIDRAALARRVFGDDDRQRAALKYLEGLVHPRTRLLITSKLRVASQQGIRVAVLDVPLLFESGWDESCDEVWCVDSDPKLRLRRARDRGWDAAQLRHREANQIAIEEKKRRSDVVIANDDSLQALHDTVDRLWGSLLERLNRAPD